MKKTKRIIIATIFGFLFGFVCLAFASSGEAELPYAVKQQILFSRALIGFAIGISCLKFHWSLHGLLLGMLFSLPLAFSGLMAPENPEFSSVMMFVSTIILGMIYGFLIELITSLLLKAKVE
ncbi:MAG: hypothetical protein PF485_14530 [Bacteroidales bacterium]|jgi:MFS family permease|nr:hypothetical protein [Bacteroidales bacterium]